MKAVLINGSPKSNGSTALLIETVASGMKDAGIQTNLFNLSQMNINYCQGCYACLSSKICIQQDDMKLLIDNVLRSDILVMASPSYWGDVTAQMKTFIDRSLPLCDTKGKTIVPPGKKGISIAVRAGQSEAEALKLVGTFEHYMGHLGIKPALSITATGIDCIDDLKAKAYILESAYSAGLNCS